MDKGKQSRSTGRHWGVFGFGAMLFLAGCESPVDEAVEQEVAVVPEPGIWKASAFEFEIGNGTIEALTLRGFGCSGNLTPAGQPLCQSLLDGPWLLPEALPVATNGQFELTTPFGLELEGEFTDPLHAEGTFQYLADNGCCSSTGEFSIRHESTLQDSPVLPCHQGGVPEVSLYMLSSLQAAPSAARIEALTEVPITPGFQGGLMLLLDVETDILELGGELQFKIEFEGDQGFSYGLGTLDGNALSPAEDDPTRMRGGPVWVILLHKPTLSLLGMEDMPTLEGTAGTLTVTVSNACGLLYSRDWAVELTGP